MIQQIPTDFSVATNAILSPQDEKLFDSFLERTQQFVVTCKSKTPNEKVVQRFPLYFGTTEDEINPHRKMALRMRRLSKDVHYNTPKSVQNQPRSNTKVSLIMNKHVQHQTMKKQVDEGITRDKPQDSTKGLPNTANPSSVPDASNKSSAPSPNLTSSSTPSSITTPTPTLTPTPVQSNLSMAEHLRLQSKSKNRPTSNERSKTPSANVKSPNISAYDTVSNEFSSALTPNLLGITLLRIMFDSKYLNIIFNKNSNPDIQLHGLQNAGNICYMNSILQFLFYCGPFSRMLDIIRDNTVREIDESKSKTPILNSLLDLQDDFKSKNSSPEKFEIINPDKFYQSISKLPRFSHLRWGQQEDAEEFLNILLDGLHEEFVESIKSLPTLEVEKLANSFNNKDITNKIIQNVDYIKDSSKENASALNNDAWNEVGSNMKTIGKRTCHVKLSPIVSLFGGQFKSVLKASNKKSSITLDPFMQVQLDISDPNTNDLIGAFEKFSQDEEVSLGSNTAKKQNFIDKLPSILIIHLKRFSFVANDEYNSENAEYEVVSSNKKNKKQQQQQQQQQQQNKPKNIFDGRIEKIHKFIKYEHSLTLPTACISAMVNEEPTYKLLGVVYHHGRSTENGHYTADELVGDKEWVRIDDINVTKIDASDAIADQNLGSNINKTAYILMYQKV